MCGGMLDRRRVPAGDNIVSMPARGQEEHARATDTAAAPPEKPERLADEHIPHAVAPMRQDDAGSFSIFGVDTGGPLRQETVPTSHGPSFLGLGEADGSGDYLLEEEDSHGGRKFLMVVALLIVGGLAYLQYRADMPVTSIWASIKSRATGQPAPPQAQEPAATGTQPTQPTSTKPDNATNPAADANAQTPATSTSPNPAQPSDNANPATAQSESSAADKASADKAAAESASNAAADKTAAAANPEKAAKKKSPDMIAKAQRPQSDNDQPADEEPAKPTRKPSAATPRNSEADALVTRAQGFLYGRGGAKSCSTAISLLKQAAGQGSSKADSQLGAMYATGNCAPFDRAEAYRWFSKAAEVEPRNAYLQQSRDMMWREMSPQERHKVLE